VAVRPADIDHVTEDELAKADEDRRRAAVPAGEADEADLTLLEGRDEYGF
jgi:hypothetical protein